MNHTNPYAECGDFSPKHYENILTGINCCSDVFKVFRKEKKDECVTNCNKNATMGHSLYSCNYYCEGKAAGLDAFKNDTFDSEAALNITIATLGNDEKWKEVKILFFGNFTKFSLCQNCFQQELTKIFDECSKKVEADMKKLKKDDDTKNYAFGLFISCMKKRAFLQCPHINQSEDCVTAKNYFICREKIEKNHEQH